jgi:glutamate N-acetyltransferase/amino-acid N-acetyltransferase
MSPKGFTFSAVNAGVKSPAVKRADMGLIFCDREAVASGVFTLNQVKAAPVLIGMELVERGTLRAVIANAGNANACTGSEGMEDARRLMNAVAQSLGIERDDVAPLSTGVIGVRLPVQRMLEKIPELAQGLKDDPDVFARSIMTTDTYPKVVTHRAGAATVLGIAKGAGMIAPDMATTLAVVLTDAVIDKQSLDNIIKKSIRHTFNAVTIDGDTSTNDTLLALASGYMHENIDEIQKAISAVIRDLAVLIVRDGEGATKFVEVRVEGAQSEASAKTVAMAVSNSLLVKTALFGADPNWGRIMGAIGYSKVPIDPERIGITISGHRVVEQGREAQGFSEEFLHELLEKKDISISINLGSGPGFFTAYTTDLSYDYVKINSEYRT